MMKIALIHFTGKGTRDEKMYAARLLAFTKSTRLQMTPEAFAVFEERPEEEVLEELRYMSSTIASSWEFVDMVFAVNNISRACAQQMTRTRTASFAMQSQRVTDMSSTTFHVPDTVKDKISYQDAFDTAMSTYHRLVRDSETLEDARGVLPMNTHCNLIAKYNLRAWVDLVRSRDSLRVQGEYHSVIAAMKEETLKVWPWVKTFLEPKHAKSIAIIEQIAASLPHEQKILLAKAADLLKKDTA